MSENIVKVDARGKACPMPIVMTYNELKAMKDGKVVTTVDSENSVKNLKNLGAEKDVPVEVAARDGEWDVTFTVGPDGIKTADTDQAFINSCATTPAAKNLVIAVTSDAMGTGDDKLGRQLMKGFLFAVSQLDDAELPKTILFYNGGAKLTCEGSLSLEDLENLVDRGVKIMTCGTCLNYYGLEDKLKVGTVTNMYSIAETLAQATQVVRP
ncbi:MAG: sulfurtransferase-like selenium metabolism protein YedF [Atopobiaceae bacterium]